MELDSMPVSSNAGSRPEVSNSPFAFPEVGKAGLGNMLFPWARAELFAKETGARLLAPRWARLRIGPYLRNEPEKRRYSGFFYSNQHLHGWRRLELLLRGRRVSERHWEGVARSPSASHRPVVVEFQGLGEFFTPLLGAHEHVRDQLWQMTEPSLRAVRAQAPAPFIAMHVRRGDITRQGFNAQQLENSPQYTALSWFIEGARAVRRVETLRRVPIVVFSDGDREELAELLRVDGVELQSRRPAVADLWEMSEAELLFASGFSTFSMWASYLGGMPTLYAPGKIQQLVQVRRPASLEIELAGGSEIPPVVVAAASRTKEVISP
jgi:hypothetical protein